MEILFSLTSSTETPVGCQTKDIEEKLGTSSGVWLLGFSSFVNEIINYDILYQIQTITINHGNPLAYFFLNNSKVMFIIGRDKRNGFSR